MDDEDNQYELERQKTIAENRLLLDSLGLDPSGASKIPGARSSPGVGPGSAAGDRTTGKKRKAVQSHREKERDDGPRRRSGRLAGLEAEGEELKLKLEVEEKEREVLRVLSRKEREQVMKVGEMVEDAGEGEVGQLERYLTAISQLSNPRSYPSEDTTSAYADLEPKAQSAEVARLKDAFKDMSLRANAKVTPERVYCMVVHPEPTKNLVFVGDKNGMVGIWDALGPSEEKVKDEDDTSGVKVEDANQEEYDEGRIWRVQAHARSSITAMKVDPINGSGLYSSCYDCTLRHLDFSTLTSTEIFSLPDPDMLVTHFDLTPNGQEAWVADKNGGISHCDFRIKGSEQRRRWVVQEEGRAAKLGGLSVNPITPHLLVTAGNDQHLRIWDTRHLSHLSPKATDILTPPPSANAEHDVDGKGDTKRPRIDTGPTSNIPSDKVLHYLDTKKGAGLLRASYQHGKSCSAAYWDPWGRRVLTTSYDDKLRVFSLNPTAFDIDAPLPPKSFTPTKQIPHNCQTGRWLTILRAQWSLNTDYTPHFTVGNMKRTLDVFAASGEKIVGLWTDAVTAVPAVTASHPSKVDVVVGGNTSGRIQLWASDRTS